MHKLSRQLGVSMALTVTLLVTNVFPLQAPKRISFQRGRSSATVSGTVAKGGPDFWVIGAKAGQTMVVHVDGDVTFGLDSPRGQMTEDDGNTSWRGQLDFDGDHTIRVYSAGGVQKYSLTVSIR